MKKHTNGRDKKNSIAEQVLAVRATLNLTNRVGLNRVETTAALGYRHPTTVDRLVERGLLHPSRATRRPIFSVEELQRFLRDTVA
jgi:hypothetical protein